jgi:glycolate oxidase FAD binding subunit
MESLTIDGYGPLPVAQPQSVDELCTVVQDTRAQGRALYPVGGRTMLALGMPPSRPGTVVDLTGLHRVIDYPARDMTITVQAGITMAALREILAREKQRLPIDVPRADRATLGGALATNQSGPRRLGHGTLRDYLIGISAVNDDAIEIKAGGRVVKNVAGYDLCKLFIGSLGTLGVITQATLKLKPLAEAHGFVTFGCKPESIELIFEQLHESRTRPVAVDLLNPAARSFLSPEFQRLLPAQRWMCVVGFEDNQEAVHWQLARLREELDGTAGVEHLLVTDGNEAASIWSDLVEFPAKGEVSSLSFKANFVPSATAAFCRTVPGNVALQVHAGNGVAIGHLSPEMTSQEAGTMLQQLTGVATNAHGNVVLSRCPPAWKGTLPVWGTPREDYWLMRAVKDKLDPNRIFNPGRYVDGI